MKNNLESKLICYKKLTMINFNLILIFTNNIFWSIIYWSSKNKVKLNCEYYKEKKSFPFTAVIGQEEMKLALLLNVIDPRIGGNDYGW